jgi:hypothetical protein
VPDDTKKPKQNDQDVGWAAPKDDPSWKPIELYGKPPTRPNVQGWYELNPETNGITVTYGESDNLLKVMCGGIAYEINWDNLWPTLPVPTPPPVACDPRKDRKMTYLHAIKDVKYKAYVRRTKCLLQVNCVIEYWTVTRTLRCDKSLKKWKQDGADDPDGLYKTRANFFTCPCGE